MSDETMPDGDEPVTFDRYDHVPGPFFHGTTVHPRHRRRVGGGARLELPGGARLEPRVLLSARRHRSLGSRTGHRARRESTGRGHIYVVEPTGPFEDDPNVTNKRFPGNVTQSYRTRHPMRIVGELTDWEGHAPEVLQGMLANLARLREQGLDVIED